MLDNISGYVWVLIAFGYIVIGAITAYICGRIDDGNEDTIAMGIFWPFVLVFLIIVGFGWLCFVAPFRLGQKHYKSKIYTISDDDIGRNEDEY